jgi:two-component system sensor histidine kinase YesM
MKRFIIKIKNIIDRSKKIPLAIKLIDEAELQGYQTDDDILALIKDVKSYKQQDSISGILWQQAKFSELQSQINPHFLYNTLESIRGQAIGDDNIKVADMTEALAKYFRYSISKESDIVELKQEIENISNYIRIQQYRFEDRFEFKVYIDEQDHAMLCKMPKMSLQPIVENSVYHGLESKISDGLISLRIEKSDKKIRIIVQDNGQGIPYEKLKFLQMRLEETDGILKQSELEDHMGIALLNVNHRIKLMFGKEYGLFISSTVDLGTEVMVVIPFGECL